MVFAKPRGDRGGIEVFENENAVAEQEARVFGSTTCDGGWHRRNEGARETDRGKGDPDISPGRYLRGGVRSLHALLLFNLRRRERAARMRETQGDDSRRRP